MLKINSKAPNFTLSSTSKDKYSLKDSFGKYVRRRLWYRICKRKIEGRI